MNKIKLVCVPYAGGSAVIYRKWNDFLNHNIEMVPVELPGRGELINLPLHDNMEDLAKHVYQSIKEMSRKEDYALFGHSMGCWIIYEVYKLLKRNKEPLPKHIFFSGNIPPHIGDKKKLHAMSDDDFIKEILNMGNTPKQVFEIDELKNLFLPILRSDYCAIENYQNKKIEKVKCGFSILLGTEEKVSRKDVAQWEKYAIDEWDLKFIQGDHFFLLNNKLSTIKYINETLTRSMEGCVLRDYV